MGALRCSAGNFNRFDLNSTGLKALAIIAPKDSFTENHLNQLDHFLAQGKGIFIALNRVDIDLNQEAVGHSINTGLETWLAKKGVVVNENFVLDVNNVPIGIQQQNHDPFWSGNGYPPD
ncbi:MAG: hypothetical protein HC906_06055 [Bacteroidales bacterium]|nr:hypothetical protein [Bacteroidales bacterium]